MKRKIILTLFFVAYTSLSMASNEIDSLLHVLDRNIDNHQTYISTKERRIQDLKNDRLSANLSSQNKFYINSLLASEYNCYVSDSTLMYLNENLDIAFSLKDVQKANETNMDLVSVLTSLGLYKEAEDVLRDVDAQHLDKAEQIKYYSCQVYLYGGLTLYTQDNRRMKIYMDARVAYQDSLLSIADHESEDYLRIMETRLRSSNIIDEALKINDKRLKLTQQGSKLYALVAYHRSLLYNRLGNHQMRKKYLIISALIDIELSNKDNGAVSSLASLFYEEKDIARAYKYIRFSLANADSYNTKLRRSEILSTQRIIDKAYQTEKEKQSEKIRSILILVSVLSILLVVALVYIYLQMRKLSMRNKYIRSMNQQLSTLNDTQKAMNERLKETNTDLSEANNIKEEYIGTFLNLCSAYVDKLDDQRKMVKNKLTNNEGAELLRWSRYSIREEEMKLLYENFDTMFLDLYPDFIEKFNDLLRDDEQIVLKKGEVLNTELRIFALIRLGLEDSSQIASFLGYSVNTIYNYRAKVKNKTKISRDDFESTVSKIGTFMSKNS